MLVVADNNPTRHIKQPWVNWALIALCVVIFFLDPPVADYAFTPVNLMFVDSPKSTTGWDVIALQSVSYIFMHGDLWHLGGNMLALWVFGNNIEDSMGHTRYPLFFVLCGIAGAFAEGFFSPTPGVPVIGASGAVAGVMGAYLLLHPSARVLVLVAFRVPVLVPAGVFVGLVVALDVISAMSFVPGGDVLIAFWAHIGGFAAGVLLILVMRHRDVPLFQTATAYPEQGFGPLGRFMIDLGPGTGDGATGQGRRFWFTVKALLFFIGITVIAEMIFA